MKSTFALFVLAALTPCLVTIERLAAAAPEAAGDACCEKSCCAEKAGAGDQACCDQAGDCKQSAAGSPCSQGDAKSTAATTTTECSDCELKTAAASAGNGLKLFWTLPLSAPKGATLSATEVTKPCTSSPCATPACASSACANSPVACGSGSSKEEAGNGLSLPSQLRYAAIPAAVPSPFAKGGEFLSAPVLATQAYAATLPLQTPPVPVTQASANLTVPAPNSCPTSVSGAVAPHPVPCSTCVAPAATSRQQPQATQVMFSVDVIEDSSNSLAEYESLQSEMPLLTAESEIILSTVRILEKQNLLRRLSNPRLVTLVGRPAILQVGSETPAENGGEPVFCGLRMEVAAREMGGGLEIEFKLCDTSSNHCYQVATSLLVAHGQTVVMKTSHPKMKAAESENGGDERPVYVVLTPQIVK